MRYIKKPFPGYRHIYAPFDAVVVCCTFLHPAGIKVWPLIQGLQICKLIDLTGYVYSYGP